MPKGISKGRLAGFEAVRVVIMKNMSLACFLLVFNLANSSNLKMEAIYSSEMLVGLY
jgi:hypothetical protein